MLLLSSKLMISDAHAHISNLGIGPQVYARKFKECGGWFIALVSLPPYHYGLSDSLNDFIKSLSIHTELCRVIASYGIKVSCLVGMHPAYIDRVVKNYQNKPEKIIKLINGGLNYILNLLKKGYIDGIGEVGRPHYRSIPESFSVNNYVLMNALRISKDYGAVLHLHLEDKGLLSVISINGLCSILGFKNKCKVVFHHASITTSTYARTYGFSSTIVGRYEVIKNLIERSGEVANVMLESDYIDDPRRPGVVMYPWQISYEVNKLLNTNPNYADVLSRLLVDNVVKVYGVEPP